MSGLPKGWVNSTLAELSDLMGGKTPSKAEPRFWENGTIPWVSPKDMKVFDLYEAEDRISDVAVTDGGMRLLPVKSILMVTRSGILAHTFPVAITHQPVTINQDIKAVPPDPRFDTRYLAFNLKSQGTTILSECTKAGTTVASVETEKLNKLPIPLAPLPEQKRIADKLDSVLARVDACRERLDGIPTLLKRFRQSVLAAATSGRLTEDWRLTHTKSRQLGGWVACSVGELLLGKPRNGYSPKSVDYPTPVRSLTLSATTSGVFKGQHFKYIDEPIPNDSHLWLKPGDILIQRANTIEYVGVSAIFDGNEGEFIYPDLMMKCQANGKIIPHYLHHLLSADGMRTYFRDNATGTAGNMPKINQQTLMSAPAQLPPLPEQHEIVRRVETLFAFADRLEARCTAARKQVGQLTPALLAKAFRGELVPQDPNDEPAAELLKRLAASRGDAPLARRGRRSPAPDAA